MAAVVDEYFATVRRAQRERGPADDARHGADTRRRQCCRGTNSEAAAVSCEDNAIVEARSSLGGAASAAPALPFDERHDRILAESVRALPSNYNFEIPKTVRRIRQSGARRVALQLPEGLQIFACTLADILARFAECESVVLGDVTYGACCVDDYSAAALGCDLLVHYGHSCLVPVQQCSLPTMYVFVDIKFDTEHFIQCVCAEFGGGGSDDDDDLRRGDAAGSVAKGAAPPPSQTRLVLVSTIQFASTLHTCAAELKSRGGFAEVRVPQKRPLSPAELLGCTAPVVDDDTADADAADGSTQRARVALLYVGDGRFHLESAMIHNPTLPAYRYDPYGKVLSRETYDHARMMQMRRQAVTEAARAFDQQHDRDHCPTRGADVGARRMYGLIMGTLGRQGSPAIVKRLEAALHDAGVPYVIVLCSEITPAKLAQFARSGVEAWVQVACPRLSIDWGAEFGADKPVLTPYEAMVALGKVQWRAHRYPMDYYARDGGAWSNYYDDQQQRQQRRRHGGGGGARPRPP